MTLSHVHKTVVIWTDPTCWHDGWEKIADDTGKLMQQDRLVDALLHAMNAAYAYLAERSNTRTRLV